MDYVLFDSVGIKSIERENLRPNVVKKFQNERASLDGYIITNNLDSYNRCGISIYVSKIISSMKKIEREIHAVDRYVNSAVSNYRALESRLQGGASSSEIDSDSLSNCLSSVVEISKFSREYKSEDSRSHLEYNPQYTSPTNGNVQSQKRVTYGGSASKYVSSADSNYSVSSVYRSNILTTAEDNQAYSIDISEFIDKFKPTSSASALASMSNVKLQTNSVYQQGESTN